MIVLEQQEQTMTMLKATPEVVQDLEPLSPRKAARQVSMTKQASSRRSLRSLMSRRSSLSTMDALDVDTDEEEPLFEKQPARPTLTRRSSLRQQLSTRRLSMSNLFAGYEKVHDPKRKSNSKDSLKSKSYHGKSFRRKHQAREVLRSTSCHGKVPSSSTSEVDATECLTATEAGSEYDAELLLDTLDKRIDTLQDLKKQLEQKIVDQLELAKARYKSGSHGTCTLIAMRSATKYKAMRACTVSSRFGLIELRKQLKSDLQQARSNQSTNGSEVVQVKVDILADVKRSMQETLRKFSNGEACSTPSNEVLLDQLRRLVEEAESEAN